MDNKHVVIAAATRTPIGAFQGVLAPATAPQLGAAAIKGALAAAGVSGRRRPGSHHGLRVARGPGPGARAPGRARRRHPRRRAHHHHQQDVRLGHEGHHDGRRPDSRRRRVDRGGRRPRVHDQRALSTAQGARRHAHGPRRSARPHVLRRPAEPVRRPAHGRVRREHRAEVFVLARRPGCVRHRIHAARAEGGEFGRFRGRDRAGHRQGPQGRDRGRQGRDAIHRRPRQDRDAEARVPQGRHGHRRVVVLDFRWRGGGGADVGRRSRAPRHQAAGAHPRLHELRAGTRVVHHRARRRHPETAGATRLESRRRSSL